MFTGYQDQLSSDTRWKIRWLEIEKGKPTSDITETFHNTLDGWYKVLPKKWDDKVSAIITSEANVKKTTFFVPSKLSDGKYSMSYSDENSVLSIYVISKDLSETLLRDEKIKVLKRVDDLVYAYKTYENDYVKYAVQGQEVENLFKLINNSEWNIGGLEQ